jgi:L-amino acid N-acyltransferase YncA
MMGDSNLKIVVRNSAEADVPSMIAIYSHHVQHGLGPEDLEPLHPDDVKRRRKNMLKHKLPHLVAALDDIVVGYAYAVPFRKRPAYRYAVKHSIYVHHEYLHCGVGRRLLPALVESCAAAGYRQMIAYIDAANAPSIQLHEGCEFRHVGVLREVGFKFGRWTDSVMMQRALGVGAALPPEKHAGKIADRALD